MDMLDNMLDDVLESSLSDIDDLDSLLIDGVDDEDSGAATLPKSASIWLKRTQPYGKCMDLFRTLQLLLRQ